MTRRLPKPSRFAWSRFPHDDGSSSYRLFRRDLNGALHMEALHVPLETPRATTAQTLRIVRRNLRERVDEIDLHIMGVEA